MVGFACRGCDAVAAHPTVIDLGCLPLGNSLLRTKSDVSEVHPLALAFCEHCTLLQTKSDLPPGKRLNEILYFSAVSPALLAYGNELAELLIKRCTLGSDSSVVEIGSNDGYFLEAFARRGIAVQGIEPASHSVALANVPTVEALFTEAVARELDRTFDLVVANFVLELIPDLPDFARGMRTLMKPDATAIIEVPYARALIDKCRLDGIAHLRLSWFTLTSIQRLFPTHGLYVTDAETLPFRDGTLRVLLSSDKDVVCSQRAKDLLRDEHDAGLTSAPYYAAMSVRMNKARAAVRRFVADAKLDGKTVAAYGAGIKASTLLNFVGLGREQVSFIVDANQHKHGRFMPGVGIPIVSPQMLLDERPDYTILLALDLADEVINQQSAYCSFGGRFVIPLPEPKIV